MMPCHCAEPVQYLRYKPQVLCNPRLPGNYLPNPKNILRTAQTQLLNGSKKVGA